MDPLTDMYDVPFDNMLEVGNFSDKDLYNLIITNKKNSKRVLDFYKRTNKNKFNYLLLYAVKEGNADIVELLINAGADINNIENDILLYAVKKGYTDVVELLINAGADVNKGRK